MQLVSSLLEFPVTTAFSAVKSNVVDTGSASPPHKRLRLDTQSDVSDSLDKSNRNDASANARIIIKVLGKIPSKSDSLSDKYIMHVKGSIETILDPEESKDLTEPLDSIHNKCRHLAYDGRSQAIYDHVKRQLERYTQKSADELGDRLRASIKSGKELDGLKELLLLCQKFQRQVMRLQSVLAYIDLCVAENGKTNRIGNLAHHLLTVEVFYNRDITQAFHQIVIHLLSNDRDAFEAPTLSDERATFRKTFAHLIPFLTRYGVYSNLEEFYLRITRDYYLDVGKKKHDEEFKTNALGFFKHLSSRIDDEITRTKEIFQPGSWASIQNATERALLFGKMEWLANEAVKNFMDSKNYTGLTSLYHLYSRVDGVKIMGSSFKSYVQHHVETIVKDQEHDDQMVDRLLKFKELAEFAISTSFVNIVVQRASHDGASSSNAVAKPNSDFMHVVFSAFQQGFKARKSRPAEMLAKYLDNIMRKGQGGKSDEIFQNMLNSVLSLYRFSDDKDVFRIFYSRQLAKRLLLQKSASDDFETKMILKLKLEYDSAFSTSEDLFKDLRLSRELVDEYHNTLPLDSRGRRLQVMVLQRSSWPFAAEPSPVIIPLPMLQELKKFENYYKTRHESRQLDWDFALSSVTMTSRFESGPSELSMSLYQATVLLLFNDEDELGYETIKERTKMNDDDLRRTLQSLACNPKRKVLDKIPKGKDVADTDQFRYNSIFPDKRPKVHINSIQAKISVEESRKTQASIDGDRKHYLEAAIVRIMKGKKELSYEKIKIETIEAVKGHFVPTIQEIKKRVDYLVEAEYLERSKKDRNTYVYLA